MRTNKYSFKLESWSDEEKFYSCNRTPWDAFKIFIEEFDLYDTWEKIIFEIEEMDVDVYETE